LLPLPLLRCCCVAAATAAAAAAAALLLLLLRCCCRYRCYRCSYYAIIFEDRDRLLPFLDRGARFLLIITNYLAKGGRA